VKSTEFASKNNIKYGSFKNIFCVCNHFPKCELQSHDYANSGALTVQEQKAVNKMGTSLFTTTYF
jgi:ssDNA-binding Zn-finger/Zn-ribbon topoisomerase 1